MRTEKQKLDIKIHNFDMTEKKMNTHGQLLPSTIRALICGPSNCGKTNVMISLLIDANGLRFKNVYVYSKSLQQEKYEFLKQVLKRCGLGYFGYSDNDDVIDPSNAEPNSVFIFDDVACEKQDKIRNYFCMGRHNAIDSFYLSQTYSKIPKQLVRDNTNVLILFKQDDLNLKHIYDDHVNTDFPFNTFKHICSECWKDLYGFLVIVKDSDIKKGTFGFLSTEDDVIRGNAGLKDQVLALQWTRENIASFGGNPSEITIFGESAGAGSVGYHIVSPMSRNLFKGAIMESGCALFGTQSGARDVAYTLANQVNSSITNSSTSEQVLNVLQQADVYLVVNLTSGKAMGAILEIQSNLSFMSEPIYETLEAGGIARVPTIIGYNSEESIAGLTDLDYAKSEASRYDSDPELLVPSRIHLKENVTKEVVGEEIRQHYLGKNGSFAESLAVFYDWTSDNSFLRSSHKQAVLQSQYSPVYMYQFSYYGSLSKGHLVIPGAGKVGHAEEVGYLFNISTKPLKTDEDFLTRKRFVKLWTNFAKTSNPTPDDDSAELLQNVKWEPVTEDNLQYLDIDNDLQIKPNRKVNENILWNHIWNTYSYRPYNSY